MKPALGAEGRAALAHVMAGSALLAFDFDGTLAPIVARPQDARVPLGVARRLARLSERVPVAVITGRAVADVVERLGFSPRFTVGSHGAEDLSDPDHLRWPRTLEPVRQRLRRQQALLAAAGVMIEDKQHSIALHHRLAPNPARALAAIDFVLTPSVDDDSALEDVAVHAGHGVVNLSAGGAPDKGDALLSLALRAGATAALFVGDDRNDEPAFMKARPDWMTVRIGGDGTDSRARFHLAGPSQITILLQSALDLMPPR